MLVTNCVVSSGVFGYDVHYAWCLVVDADMVVVVGGVLVVVVGVLVFGMVYMLFEQFVVLFHIELMLFATVMICYLLADHVLIMLFM